MDKEKVKELIQEVIRSNVDSLEFSNDMHNAPLRRANSLLHDALIESDKHDWISVENRLPEFGERVYTRITNIDGATVYPVTKREKDGETILVRDYHKFVVPCLGCSVTHWKPIEKLEE